jgi:predicted phage-related endonuclease
MSSATEPAIQKKLIGTSDYPAFVPGASKYFGLHDVWNRVVRGIEPQRDDWLRVAGRAGQLDERATARLYLEEIQGVWEEDSDAALVKVEQRVDVPGRPWQRYHAADFLARLPAQVHLLIECKNRSRWGLDSWGPDGTDQVAPDVLAQVQGQLEAIRHDRDRWVGSDLPELDDVVVAVRVDGAKLRHFCVQRDPEIGALLVERVERFVRDYVIPERQPPLDGSAGADAELERAFAAHSDRVRAPTAAELDLVREHKALVLTRKEIEVELAEVMRELGVVEQRLKGAIGQDLGIAIEDDFKILWKERRGRAALRKVVDYLAFKRLGLSKEQLKQIEEEQGGAKPHRALVVSYQD